MGVIILSNSLVVLVVNR